MHYELYQLYYLPTIDNKVIGILHQIGNQFETILNINN